MTTQECIYNLDTRTWCNCENCIAEDKAMEEREEKARAKIAKNKSLAQYADTLLDPELTEDEHFAWILKASVKEIASWARSMERELESLYGPSFDPCRDDYEDTSDYDNWSDADSGL